MTYSKTNIYLYCDFCLYEIDSKLMNMFSICLLFHRPNVCNERKEELSDWNSPSNEKEEEGSEVRESTSTTINGGFHFSFNTCVEKANKRTCKTV